MSGLDENQSFVRLADRNRVVTAAQMVEVPVGILGRDRGQKFPAPIEDPQEPMLRTDRSDGTDAINIGRTVESGNIDILYAIQANLARLKEDFLAERSKIIPLKIEYLNPVVLGIGDIQMPAFLAHAEAIGSLGRGNTTVDFVPVAPPERRSSCELPWSFSMSPKSQHERTPVIELLDPVVPAQVGMGIAHIDVTVRVESQTVGSGSAELARTPAVAAEQHLEIAAGIEFLHPLIPGIAHEEVVVVIHTDSSEHEELPCCRSMARLTIPIHCAQRPQRSSSRAHLLHAVVGLVGNEDVAQAVRCQPLWIMELPWKPAPLAGTKSI